MGRNHTSGSALSRLASALMLMALIVRAALPQGWMPAGDSASASGASFTICTVTGPLQLKLDQEGNPVPDSPDGTAHQPCAFAALASLSAPADSQAISPPQLHESAYRPPASQLAPEKPSHGPSGARAPPATRALS
jgi:hypothetical protein